MATEEALSESDKVSSNPGKLCYHFCDSLFKAKARHLSPICPSLAESKMTGQEVT